MCVWNLNGWYENKTESKELKKNIIENIDSDVVGLCETHLKDNYSEINLPGYTWFGNNRCNLSNRAVRGSGGVGILLKNQLLKEYDATILDRTFEGILWVRLCAKNDISFSIKICVAYLTPEGSSRGNVAQEFYDMLLSQVYLYFDENPMVIMGDLNGRMGDKQEFNPMIDAGNIPKRHVTDNTLNRYGEYLYDFLSDSKTCVLNGRFDHNKDNFTCVTSRGRSVVDYIIVPHTHFEQMLDFETVLVSDCVEQYKLQIGFTTLPDHSILRCKLNISCYVQMNHDTEKVGIQNQEKRDNPLNRCKYKTGVIPTDMFANERAARAITHVIERLETFQSTQQDIDNTYNEFIQLVTDEMNDKLSCRVNARKSTRKSGRHKRKHWWNDELSELWKIVKINESLFLQCKGSLTERKMCRQRFKQSRKEFDKKTRQAERQYRASHRDYITSLKTNNPKKFWEEINKLGPSNEKQKIDSVKFDNGCISYEQVDILRKWKDDFSNLFKDTAQASPVSDVFLDNTRKLLSEWEEQIESIDYNDNEHSSPIETEKEVILNSEITMEELISALHTAKANKATGIENIPNEVLKCERLKELLLKLFQRCFENNILPSKWEFSIIHPILKKGKDYRLPLSYRSISLMSTVAKLFNSILCKRITEYLDNNDLLCEEQNGFRRLRSCIDHIYTLYTILRKRKSQN